MNFLDLESRAGQLLQAPKEPRLQAGPGAPPPKGESDTLNKCKDPSGGHCGLLGRALPTLTRIKSGSKQRGVTTALAPTYPLEETTLHLVLGIELYPSQKIFGSPNPQYLRGSLRRQST